jgi:hypothetical protein
VGIDVETFRQYLQSAVQDLFAQDYLQEAFGYDCVDAGQVPGKLGSNPDLYFIRRLGFAIIPVRTSMQSMDMDQLLDLIEVLHDIVSKGDEDAGTYHAYNQCGWHFNRFEQLSGQSHVRQVLNPLLARLPTPLVLEGDGLLRELAPSALRPLIEAPVPTSAPEDEVKRRVEAAVEHYRRARAGIAERRAAVRELADVLEFLRPTIKANMLRKDEATLFDFANNFAVRHNDRLQKRDYDESIWLSWAFYVYLATIQAVLRITERHIKN